MADVIITVLLEGEDISPASFATAVSALNELFGALAAEVASDSTMAWDVESAEDGSAITVRGRVVAGRPDGPERVSAAYESVGNALAQHQTIPYSLAVQRPVGRLTALLQGDVVAIRLETPQRDFTITEVPPPVQASISAARSDLGAVEGRIEALSRREKLRFVLYDTLDNKAIACYLDQGNEDMVQQLWGRRAIVEGEVRRDPLTGHPTAIRHISAVTPVPELGPNDWRAARRALPWDGIPAEEAIRQVRDGW